MIEITAEIRAFIDKAAAGVELAEDEYIDPSDGLIHCKKCGGQRQTVVPCFGKSGYFMPRCICQCQQEAEEQRKAAEERQRRMERIKRRKAQGLQDRYLYDYTFANDNGQNPLMDKAHAYVENWKEAYKNNTGLLLFGDVGTGKSFFAGCIANALLDRDVPVLMTNFPTILNRLTGMFSEDRADFIASFNEYDLLIIDDLGVERSTEYAMEQMLFVIDSRYRSRRPMIITTNLKLADLKNPPAPSCEGAVGRGGKHGTGAGAGKNRGRHPVTGNQSDPVLSGHEPMQGPIQRPCGNDHGQHGQHCVSGRPGGVHPKGHIGKLAGQGNDLHADGQPHTGPVGELWAQHPAFGPGAPDHQRDHHHARKQVPVAAPGPAPILFTQVRFEAAPQLPLHSGT